MSSEEMLQQLGAFDPREMKDLIAALESQVIPFEVESDHSAVTSDGNWMSHNLGIYPEGSKLVIFVPESIFSRARKVMRGVFPE
jgi:hypothetical protein